MYLWCIVLIYGTDCGDTPDLPSLLAVAFLIAVMAFCFLETAFVSGIMFLPTASAVVSVKNFVVW